MPSTIILYNELGSGASTSGTWSRISASGPSAPGTYNASIDFTGYSVDSYVYRYTVGDSSADVTVDWQGEAPDRTNGECDSSYLITGTLYPPFVVSVSDSTAGACGPKGQQIPSVIEDPIPSNWNQGTYTGDLWYSLIIPAQASTYTLIFELTGQPYNSSGVFGPALAVYTGNMDDECVDKTIAGSIAGNAGNQRAALSVIIPANMEKMIWVRAANLLDYIGSFNLSVTALGNSLGTVSGGAAGSGSRIVQYVHDSGGTGILLWTENSGVLPDNLTSGFEVYSNGQRLEYTAQYTVTPDTAPGQSTVTIVYPVPDQYYTMIAYYE